ncbi:MAG: hypothetical protein NTV93_01285 [Verrucomicrobia bacterium]|nr:hypothetical protein [Verrucomicrobiota bacterium]
MPSLLNLSRLAGYAVYLGCVFLARPVPLPLVFLLGKALGATGYFILRGRRKLAESNIRAALGITGPEAHKLARRNFMILGANLLSMLKMATMSDARIWRHVTFEIAPEIPQEAGRKGWVAVLSHMSNWELVGRISKLFPQYRFGAIYQKLSNARVNRHFNESRARLGVTLFDRKEGFWNSVAFLESGGVLGVLTDQYAGVSGTWMPFFGRLTSTSTLAAALAHRVGVEMVPVAIKTTGLARWHVSVGHPLPKGGTPEMSTAAINSELERQIAASPDDWLWSHDRWKTPRFGFLLSASNRRIFFPPGFHLSKLAPYRILVRSVDDPSEAGLSVSAVRAIKHGRPDAHVTVVAAEGLENFWGAIPEVDEVIPFSASEGPLALAGKIARTEGYQVGILLPGTVRAAVEMALAGVPYRLGPPARFLLNDWRNPPGIPDPDATGEERYRRIAGAAGAAV